MFTSSQHQAAISDINTILAIRYVQEKTASLFRYYDNNIAMNQTNLKIFVPTYICLGAYLQFCSETAILINPFKFISTVP